MKQEHAMTPGVLVSGGQAVPSGLAFRARVADLLHLLQFAEIKTSTQTDAEQAEIAMNDLEKMLAAPAPAERVEREPEDNYESWYEEAIIASNELGYSCMSAADVIRMMGAELQLAKAITEVCARAAPQPSPCIGTELDAEQYTAHDMADQAAQGFRDGQTGVAGLVEALENAARAMWASEANMHAEAAAAQEALSAHRQQEKSHER